MAGRRGGAWFVLGIAVASQACHRADDQCIDVGGRVAVMAQPWPDWVEVLRVPNKVIDSIGPGRYRYTEWQENYAFIAYRVSIKSNDSGWVIRDSLVKRCGEKTKQRKVASPTSTPQPVTPESAQSAPAPPR